MLGKSGMFLMCLTNIVEGLLCPLLHLLNSDQSRNPIMRILGQAVLPATDTHTLMCTHTHSLIKTFSHHKVMTSPPPTNQNVWNSWLTFHSVLLLYLTLSLPPSFFPLSLCPLSLSLSFFLSS